MIEGNPGNSIDDRGSEKEISQIAVKYTDEL